MVSLVKLRNSTFPAVPGVRAWIDPVTSTDFFFSTTVEIRSGGDAAGQVDAGNGRAGIDGKGQFLQAGLRSQADGGGGEEQQQQDDHRQDRHAEKGDPHLRDGSPGFLDGEDLAARPAQVHRGGPAGGPLDLGKNSHTFLWAVFTTRKTGMPNFWAFSRTLEDFVTRATCAPNRTACR